MLVTPFSTTITPFQSPRCAITTHSTPSTAHQRYAFGIPALWRTKKRPDHRAVCHGFTKSFNCSTSPDVCSPAPDTPRPREGHPPVLAPGRACASGRFPAHRRMSATCSAARQVRFVSGTYLAGASGGTSASMEGSSFIAGLSAAPIRVRRYCR